jgi:2-keto-4-pentenoate hydratase
MISDDAAQKAAGLLDDAWRQATVIEALPADCRPASRADGYRIQSALLARSGHRSWGWKIAATSTAGQQHIGVDGPLGGRLYDGNIDAPGDPIDLSGNRMRVAEVEFAFRIGQTLAPRATAWQVDEVFDAVEALLPSIEIPDSRFVEVDRAGAPQLIADQACAWRFVPGRPAPEHWRAADLAAWTVQARVGRRYERQGIGSNVLGDPRVALTWLVNELSAQGIALEVGQVVTTGTCLPPLQIEPGDHVVADFGILGSVDARFA